MTDGLFGKYYSKVATEGWVKSAVCGFIAGFSALLLTATVTWMVGFKGVWLCFVIFAAITAILIPSFYFFRFRPTTKSIAKKVDGLGLEERLLTMVELQNDESFIAMKQREDAQKALSSVNKNLIKITVSVPLIVAICTVGVLSAGMTTVTSLYALGKIRSGFEIFADINNGPAKQFELSYEAMEGGEIAGNACQVVESGKDGDAVVAVAFDGYVFYAWSDGYKNPYRQDSAVIADKDVTAIFVELDDFDPEDSPADDELGSGNSNNNNGSGGEPQDQNGEPGDSPDNDVENGDGQGPGAGGNSTAENNQIVDGNTYYGDSYDAYHGDAVDGVSQDGDITGEEGDIIGDYFDSIAK